MSILFGIVVGIPVALFVIWIGGVIVLAVIVTGVRALFGFDD